MLGGTGGGIGIFAMLILFDHATLVARLKQLATEYDKEIFRPCDAISSGAYKDFSG